MLDILKGSFIKNLLILIWGPNKNSRTLHKILYDSVLIGENAGQWKPAFSHFYLVGIRVGVG